MSHHHSVLMHHGRYRRHEGFATEYRVIYSHCGWDEMDTEVLPADSESDSWDPTALQRNCATPAGD